MKPQKRSVLTVILFMVYVLILVGVIIFKLPFYSESLIGTRTINLIPFLGSFDENGVFILREIVSNVLIFVPLGIYLSMLNDKDTWPFAKKLLLIVALTVTLEALQFVFAIGVADITDVLANTFGGIIGIGLYNVFFKILGSRTNLTANVLASVITVFVIAQFSYLFYLSNITMAHGIERVPGRALPAIDSPDVATTTNAQPDELLLVNPDHPLPEDFVPVNLVNLYEQRDRCFQLETTDIMLCEDVYEAMNALFLAAGRDGVEEYVITSGYRSEAEQEEIYATVTDGTAAKPGTSEHQTGLAFDVGVTYSQDFEHTPQFEWLREHCAEYGFIIRYPEGMESSTGYPYEPWHYRYVGKDAATAIMDSGITLEQFCAGVLR